MIQVTDNIVLKAISLEAAKDIFNTINNEREYLRQWLPFIDLTLQEEDSLAFIESAIEHEQITYTIHFDDKFVGLIGFNNMDKPNQKAEIGYWLSEKYQGQGIITQSVLKLLHQAFGELQLNSIRILAGVENKKSRSIPERLGFKQEGILRDGELLVDNQFTDIVVYSLLKKEFY